jgi:hypothetical protein
VSLLLLIAVAVAMFVARGTPTPRGQVSPALIAKVVGLLLVLAIGGLLVDRTEKLLDAGDTGSSQGLVEAGLERAELQTAEGGSAFDAANPRSPIGYAEAAVTILFRPFPFEASGTEQLVTTAEGLFLLVLAISSWRRLWDLRRRLRDHPYYTLAIAYTLMFVFAFGTISNFGILARQRVQLLPFVFVLLAAPVVTESARSRTRQRSIG